jgi:hypothetical protein
MFSHTYPTGHGVSKNVPYIKDIFTPWISADLATEIKLF